MPSRKRSLEAQGDGPSEETPLKRIRGMWQFANLCQWIYTFGKAAKIDESVDIEEIETACLSPGSTLLLDIALALLKLISSHRGLTHEIFDSQARKQYLERAPGLNPFGTDEEPLKFQDFDTFTKIRVLQQMTQWTMIRPERIREKMDEQRDMEQTSWRIEPYGWDSQDRTYFVLDDNRVYRLTEAPPAPPPRPKKKKSYRSGRRSSRRRRTDVGPEDEDDDIPDPDNSGVEAQADGLGGMTWECLAVTLDEVRNLVDSFRKTRDENEKILRRQLENHLVPILEQQEESRKRKALQRERELLNLAKMANAKRSSRIASKIEQQRQEEKTKDEVRQHREAEEAKRREDQARLKREKERDFRLVSREKRLKEREARRLRHEEELSQLSEDSRHLDDGKGRVSERRLQVEIERNRQALRELEDEEEDWVFDCDCGLHGQIDDGTHSVACEKCNIWQHSKCLGISEEEAERPEFHFICGSCRRHQDEVKDRPRATIKLKVNRPGSDNSHSSTGESGSRTENAKSASVVKLPSKSSGVSRSGENVAPRIEYARQSYHPAPSAPVLSSEPQGITQGPKSDPNDRGSQPSSSSAKAGYSVESLHASPQTLANNEKSKDSPMIGKSPALAMTPAALGKFQGPGSGHESTLSTPAISRDIYRAAHIENGNLPARAGLSPTKHSPHSSFTLVNTACSNPTPSKIQPGITLSPTPREAILTPPTKHPEPTRPPSQQ